MSGIFVVHHNPNNGLYAYAADPTDPVASAKALLTDRDGRWVAGNCRRLIQPGDLLLFKFGGARLRGEPGLYAAAHVTRAPAENRQGTWVFQYRMDAPLTRHLIHAPLVGRKLRLIVGRSFGASIQVVGERGRASLTGLLGRYATDRRLTAEGDLTHGLVIRQEPLAKILAGTKTWEVRGKATDRRGDIALIQSRSGLVLGTCQLVDVVGPLSVAELRRNARRTGFRANDMPYPTTYAWVLRGARRLATPIPYRHPSGAVIWVRLEPNVVRRLKDARAHTGR